jgi:xanthine dehydrogenase molybdenum-binding subunit
MSIELTVNGERRAFDVPEGASLLELLRDHAGITSPKDGCSPQGQCGACLVLVDGAPALSCLRKPAQMDGRDVVTLEGVPDADRLCGEAFARMAGLQCGFCIPGIDGRSVSLNLNLTDEVIRKTLDPHLCRCTGP